MPDYNSFLCIRVMTNSQKVMRIIEKLFFRNNRVSESSRDYIVSGASLVPVVRGNKSSRNRMISGASMVPVAGVGLAATCAARSSAALDSPPESQFTTAPLRPPHSIHEENAKGKIPRRFLGAGGGGRTRTGY